MRKNVLITGAGGNLGQAATVAFLAAGYRCIAVVSPGKKSSLPDKDDMTVYEADLTDEKAVESLIASIGTQHRSIDVAILTVGGYASGHLQESDGDTIQRMLTINFNTAYFVARPVFAQMLLQKEGRIIFIGARPAISPADGKKSVAYALSKSLVFNLSEILNAEAIGKNIISSVIVPSTIDTPANRKAMPSADFSLWVTSEEIAKSMLYLASEDARALREPVLKLYSNA